MMELQGSVELDAPVQTPSLPLTDNPSLLCRFPAEIYYKIFLDIASEHSGRPNSQDREKGWLSLSEVCRDWRAIVLDMSVLWAQDICKLPCSLDTSLNRAKSTPLTIVVYYPHSPRSLREFALRPDVIMSARILTIHISSSYDGAWRLLNIWFSALDGKNLPLLEELNFFGDHMVMSEHLRAMFDSMRPFTAEGLRRIVMHCVLFPWSMSTSSISRLYLKLFSNKRTDNLDYLEHLLSALASLPHLEDLSLCAFPNFQLPLPQIRKKISMPALRRLCIYECASSSSFVAFWQSCDIPPSVFITVELNYWTRPNEQDKGAIISAQTMFFQALGPHLYNANSSAIGPLTAMMVVTQTEIYAENFARSGIELWSLDSDVDVAYPPAWPASEPPFSFYTLPLTDEIRRPKQHISLILPYHGEDEHWVYFHALKALNDCFHLTSIEAAIVLPRYDHDEADWIHFLRRVSGARALYVNWEEHAVPLIRVLGRAFASPSLSGEGNAEERTATTMLLPHLRHLHLADYEKVPSYQEKPIWRALLRTLARRSNRGYGIQSIRLVGAWRQPEGVHTTRCLRKLEEMVPKCDYDSSPMLPTEEERLRGEGVDPQAADSENDASSEDWELSSSESDVENWPEEWADEDD